MNEKTLFYDIESESLVSLHDLYSEWYSNDGKNASGEQVAFEEYVASCSVRQNGTLMKVELRSF